MTAIDTKPPSYTERRAREINEDPELSARLKVINDKLAAAVGEAADEVHALIEGEYPDDMRKLCAALMSRAHIEHVTSTVLSAKAQERGPIYP